MKRNNPEAAIVLGQQVQAIDGMTERKVENYPVSEVEVLAEELRRAISTFVRVIRDKTDTEKSAQSETLGILERNGAMNVAALALRRGVAHQTMRVVVAQMVADGLIDRSPDPEDKRSQLLSLSNIGRDMVVRDRISRASRIGTMIEATLSVEEREHLRKSIDLFDRISAAEID
ncbi:MarR family winged helix-turn-helix transcriptional regulator [Kaistia sp. 32K]|uniref:MarR family winged helix-turn-helix transcriptional regulator n=1 Tax=Kaistia sp. 32K TaxID=2795690 RepID=UPI001AEE9DEB|nr:MarR family transcriptional regulator [Kaistia sp. 32K]